MIAPLVCCCRDEILHYFIFLLDISVRIRHSIREYPRFGDEYLGSIEITCNSVPEFIPRIPELTIGYVLKDGNITYYGDSFSTISNSFLDSLSQQYKKFSSELVDITSTDFEQKYPKSNPAYSEFYTSLYYSKKIKLIRNKIYFPVVYSSGLYFNSQYLPFDTNAKAFDSFFSKIRRIFSTIEKNHKNTNVNHLGSPFNKYLTSDMIDCRLVFFEPSDPWIFPGFRKN
ncbi:hypothetical protein CPIN17262_0487 [Campylobacter pinnipediorum subsp. pinnipediorum]|uniref:hypothetical protein n=1 Tax=Campylobacter pinnipediorum TaxID=1965231 RepID=UPI0009956761|nr:hypothetical protein [Campylobacter pinnipediorum]AQW84188.1 hypothetical protein CPIN17262_0487 [Campylobacter pinnipediorum subsp. pinnipediorum]